MTKIQKAAVDGKNCSAWFITNFLFLHNTGKHARLPWPNMPGFLEFWHYCEDRCWAVSLWVNIMDCKNAAAGIQERRKRIGIRKGQDWGEWSGRRQERNFGGGGKSEKQLREASEEREERRMVERRASEKKEADISRQTSVCPSNAPISLLQMLTGICENGYSSVIKCAPWLMLGYLIAWGVQQFLGQDLCSIHV